MTAVVCKLDGSHAIGYGNHSLHDLKTDRKRFQEITTSSSSGKKNVVVMGYNTFLSLNSKALPGRINIVLTKRRYSSLWKDEQNKPPSDARGELHLLCDLALLPSFLKSRDYNHVFYIGGGQIYQEALRLGFVDRVLVTDIFTTREDELGLLYTAFFPMHTMLETHRIVYESPIQEEKQVFFSPSGVTLESVRFVFRTYERKKGNAEETQYLQLLQECLDAPPRATRNGTTRAVFAKTLQFDLHTNGFPLLTTKRMPLKSQLIEKEFLFFLQGHTDVQLLQKEGVFLWDANTSQEFLTSAGKQHLKEHDMGPMYGFQWRHYGTNYSDCNANYSNCGIDQLTCLIRNIQSNPHSRRLLITSFDPATVHLGCLWPCHSIVLQCFVRNGFLDMIMHQRSCDLFCGVPFNIASTALLLMVLAQQTKLNPGKLTLNLGDVHLYEQHLEQAKTQLSRTPYPFPLYAITPQPSIDHYTIEDFQLDLDTYRCHPRIKAAMVA